MGQLHPARQNCGAPLDRERLWAFLPLLSTGEHLAGGDILGEIAESDIVTHRVLVPPDIEGTLERIAPAGNYTLDDLIARVRTSDGNTHDLKLFHRWPVRKIRPCRKRLIPAEPLITGQRVIDTFFPLAKGGDGSNSRRIWYRQNHYPASAHQVDEC